MSRKTFNDEEIFVLRQNPFTFHATHNVLSFTKEFKELFIVEYNGGKLPRQILIDHGYDPDILGDRRVWGISQKIRAQYAKNSGFNEGYHSPAKTLNPPGLLSEKEELKQLRQRVDYLEQEIEFLKKISSIRNTRK